MPKIIWFFLLVACPLLVKAQTTLEGVVVEQTNGTPIEGAIIHVSDNYQEPLGFDISKKDGTFKIVVQSDVSELLVQVTLLGHATQNLTIENRNQSLKVQLQPQEIMLKEVKITARPIYTKKDTLIYNVQAFLQGQDKSIGDVLKRMPGIEVSESGSIKYKGEAINKFYIEGLDLLERKYGLATNNLPADAVRSVEVMEDHQPLKMLEDVSSTNKAALNIRLKDGKMNRPVGNLEVAFGGNPNDFLWLANLFAMHMAANRQTLVMYKTNNIGKDISVELEEHTLETLADPSVRDLLNPLAIRELSLEKPRYLFNKSHLFTLNNLWKITKQRQAKVNIHYLYDGLEEETEQISTYYTEESPLIIHESSRIDQQVNRLEATVDYTDNADAYYLFNQLKTNLKWNKSQSEVKAFGLLNHQYHTPQYLVSNKLNYAKKSNHRIFTLNAFVRYSSLPQILRVNNDTIDFENKQDIHRTGLYADISSDYRLQRGFSHWGAVLNAKGGLDKLRSNLEHQLLTDSVQNHIQNDFLDLTLSPFFAFDNKKGLKVNINLDIKQSLQWVNDRQYQTKKRFSHFFLLPSAGIRYKLNHFWEARLSYKHNRSVGDLLNFPRSVVMHNYRLYRTSSGVLSEQKSHSGSGTLNFRNPITTLFFNTGVILTQTNRNLISDQRFMNIHSVSSNIPYDNVMNSLLCFAYMGKYISSLRTNISVNASYNLIKAERIQQYKKYPITSSAWSILPKISTKINEYMNAQYQGFFSKSYQQIESSMGKLESSTLRISHSLQYYAFIKKFTVKVGGEHLYNEITSNTSVHVFFTDLTLKYTYKRAEFGIEWNNIFNQKTYEYTTYNGLDTYSFKHHLRPMSIMATLQISF